MAGSEEEYGYTMCVCAYVYVYTSPTMLPLRESKTEEAGIFFKCYIKKSKVNLANNKITMLAQWLKIHCQIYLLLFIQKRTLWCKNGSKHFKPCHSN